MNYIKILSFTLVGLVVSGCMTYTTPKYAMTQNTQTQSIEKKSVAYTFRRTSRAATSAEFNKNDYTDSLKGAWAPPQDEVVALKQFRNAFRDDTTVISQYLYINDMTDVADIRMEMMQQNSFNALGLFGAALSGFTWSLIPCWGDDVYTLYVEARNKEGLEKTYQLTSSVTTIVWAPFIFATPFTGLPDSRVAEITAEHWQELNRRMKEDGFFAAPLTIEEVQDKQRNRDSLDKMYKEGLLSEEEYIKASKRL